MASNYTQADLDAISAAIAQGALTVEYRDRRVTYRSLNDMLRILSIIRTCVDGGNPTAKQVRFVTRSGY